MLVRRFLYLIVFVMVAGAARAQSGEQLFDNDRQFFGGLILGMNASQVDGDTYSGFHKVGLNAGGVVFWRFSKPVAVSVALCYSQKGSRAVIESSDPYAGSYFGKYKLDLNYISVPLVFHYFLSDKYQVGFGGSYNQLISSKERFMELRQIQVDPNQFPFEDYSIDLLAGIQMVVWKGLILSARYQYGITPLRTYSNVPADFGGRDQFNNMVTFSVSYLF